MSRRAAWFLIVAVFVAFGVGLWTLKNDVHDLTARERSDTERALARGCRDRQRSYDATVAAATGLSQQLYAPFNATSVSGQTSIALSRSLGLSEEQINTAIRVGNEQKAADLATFTTDFYKKIGTRPNCTKDQLSSIIRISGGD